MLGGTKAQVLLDVLKAGLCHMAKGLLLLRIDADIHCLRKVGIAPCLELAGTMAIDLDMPVAMLGSARSLLQDIPMPGAKGADWMAPSTARPTEGHPHRSANIRPCNGCIRSRP